MILLVIWLEMLENRYRLLDIGRFHYNFLESPVQRPVFLHNLGELIHRGSAYTLNFASRQGRFQHIGGIKATLPSACTHYSMELVYEQYQIRVAAGHLDYGLHPFLEISAIFGTCHNRGYIKRYDTLFRQYRRNGAVSNLERNTLDNGRLAYARLAYQHRIVLLPAAENLDYSGDFLVTADHRVKFTVHSGFRQVYSEFTEVIGLRLRRLLLLLGISADIASHIISVIRSLRLRLQQAVLFHITENPTIINAHISEESDSVTSSCSAQCKHQVLRSGLTATEFGRFHYRDAEDILCSPGKCYMFKFRIWYGLVGENTAVDEFLHNRSIHTQSCQCLKCGIVTVTDYAEKQMVRTDAVAAGTHSLLPGITDDTVKVV